MQVRERPIESTGASAAALASGENFVVASRLLPRRERSHLMAVYGYARLVDDIGDESAATGSPNSTGSRPSSTAPSQG